MIEAIETMGLSFVWLAGEYLHGFEPHVAVGIIRRRFVAHFGVSPCHCAWLWLLIEDELFEKDCYADHKHLLWTLNLLKTDDTEMASKGRWQADEKTIRKWIYIVLEAVLWYFGCECAPPLLGVHTNRCAKHVVLGDKGFDFGVK